MVVMLLLVQLARRIACRVNLNYEFLVREEGVQDNTIEIARSAITIWWYPTKGIHPVHSFVSQGG
jgi:hypothetical protein